MNWKEELIRLYDVNADKAGEIEYKIEKKQNKGVIEENKIPYTLLPLYHSNVMAQIEVTIYEDGSFMNAAVVDGNDRFTVIPVTEKSSNRTSGNGPHPLCDNLFYIRNVLTMVSVCRIRYLSAIWIQRNAGRLRTFLKK